MFFHFIKFLLHPLNHHQLGLNLFHLHHTYLHQIYLKYLRPLNYIKYFEVQRVEFESYLPKTKGLSKKDSTDFMSSKQKIINENIESYEKSFITKNKGSFISDALNLKIEKYLYKPKQMEYGFEMFLESGSASFESGKIGELDPEKFIFKTPQGTIAIRGTKFLVKVK